MRARERSRADLDLLREFAGVRSSYWGRIEISLQQLERFERGEYGWDGERCYRTADPWRGLWVPPPHQQLANITLWLGELRAAERRFRWAWLRRYWRRPWRLLDYFSHL